MEAVAPDHTRQDEGSDTATAGGRRGRVERRLRGNRSRIWWPVDKELMKKGQ